jgi:hypothetical protein
LLIEIRQRGRSTDLRREVGAGFLEDALEPVRSHGHKSIPAAHPVGALVLKRHPERAGGDLEHHDAAIRVCDLVGINAEGQALRQAALRPVQALKRAAANDQARALVSHPKHKAAAAFVRQGNAVLHELLELEARLRLLELKMLALWFSHPGGQ